MDRNLTLFELIKELQRFEEVCGDMKVVSISELNSMWSIDINSEDCSQTIYIRRKQKDIGNSFMI